MGLRAPGRDTYPHLLRCLITLAQLLQAVVFLLLEVRLPLDFGLIKTVDNRVLALRHEDALDLMGVSRHQCRMEEG